MWFHKVCKIYCATIYTELFKIFKIYEPTHFVENLFGLSWICFKKKKLGPLLHLNHLDPSGHRQRAWDTDQPTLKHGVRNSICSKEPSAKTKNLWFVNTFVSSLCAHSQPAICLQKAEYELIVPPDPLH